MAGVKGRSGRRVRSYENCIDDIVNSSLKVVRQYIMDESLPLDKRAEVASRFALKKMPDKVEQTLSVLNISDSMIQKLLDFMQRGQLPGNNMQIPHIQSDNNYIDVEVIEPIDHKSNDFNSLGDNGQASENLT